MKPPLPINTKISALHAVDAHAHAPWCAAHIVAAGCAMHGPLLSQLMSLGQLWNYVLTVLSFGAGLCVWLAFRLGRPGYRLQSLLTILCLGGLGQLMTQYAVVQTQVELSPGVVQPVSMVGLLLGTTAALALIRHGCAEDCPLIKKRYADWHHRISTLLATLLGALFAASFIRILELPAEVRLHDLYQYLLTLACIVPLVSIRTHLWLRQVVRWNIQHEE